MHGSPNTAYSLWRKLRTPIVALSGVGVLVAMGMWGGTARPGPLFAAGLGLMIGIMAAFVLLGWWLYLSPMHSRSNTSEPSYNARKLVAVCVPIAGMLFAAGGIWDEAWHKRYGGFGNDFLWAPHFLLYSSLGMIALIALGSAFMLLRGGDIRARFRDEPLIGLIGLVAAYLVISLPGDQLWHIIYGIDLTAWSLPHISVAGGVALVMLSALALQLSFVPKQSWQGLQGMRGPEIWAIVQIASAQVPLVQIGTSEWDDITTIVDIRNPNAMSDFSLAFWQRPEWLYPVVLTVLGLFSANLTLYALRRVGAATVVALLVALTRTVVALSLDAADPGYQLAFIAYWFLIPPAIALDLWYAVRHRQANRPITLGLGNLLATGALLAVALPIIAQSFVYPRINASTLPWMIVISLVIGHAAGWAGASVGEWLATRERPEHEVAPTTRWVSRLVTAASVGALVYALMVIITARPPTA